MHIGYDGEDSQTVSPHVEDCAVRLVECDEDRVLDGSLVQLGVRVVRVEGAIRQDNIGGHEYNVIEHSSGYYGNGILNVRTCYIMAIVDGDYYKGDYYGNGQTTVY